MENTLEVGKVYKTKTGKEVYIFEEISKEYFYGVSPKGGFKILIYYPNGVFFHERDKNNIEKENQDNDIEF